MLIPESLQPCYDHVLRLKTSRGNSSSFVMSWQGEPWVVTASHIFDEVSDDEYFSLHAQDGAKYCEQDLGLLDRQHPDADVSVFGTGNTHVGLGPFLEPYEGADGSRMAGNVSLAQDVYFMGFPRLSSGLNDNFKAPLIRSAIVSGQAQTTAGIRVWVLDGMANHGFSGGPVLVQEDKSGPWRVLGVASYYVSEIVSVFSEVAPSSDNDSSPTEAVRPVLRNAGLAICYDIRHAIADIEGRTVSESPK